MERLKGKKLVLGTLLIAFLVFFVMPPQAHAQLITDIAGGAIARFAYIISYIIALILGAFMSLAAFLASIALNLNYFVISKSNSLVGIGWSIVRDVANLGFVIVIIVMAFATIVRFERYGYQKILPKLIAAAILINFSLSIAGVFVDFANILTHFFFDRISQDPVEIAGTIAGAFNPQRLFTKAPDPNQIKAEASLTDSFFLLVAQPVFTAVFLLVATFTILIFAFLLLLRFLHLTFLLIIAPIVWLFWVIPELSSKFKDWWSDFFKWLFFAPAASFFMYLALRALKESPGFWGPTQGNQLIAGLSGLENIFIQGAQMVVLVGIMLGGLIISQRMGVDAASAAVNWAGKMKGKAQGWAKTKAVGWGKRALTTGAKTEEESGKTTTGLERFAARTRNIPLLGRAFKGLGDFAAKTHKERAEESIKRKGVYEEYNNDRLMTEFNAMNPLTPQIDRAAITAELASRRDKEGNSLLDNKRVDKSKIPYGFSAIQQTDTVKQLLEVNPELADKFDQSPVKVASKIKGADVAKLSVSSLKDPKIAAALGGQITNVVRHGSAAQINAVLKGVRDARTQYNEIVKTIVTIVDNKEEPDEKTIALFTRSLEAAEKTIAQTPELQENLPPPPKIKIPSE